MKNHPTICRCDARQRGSALLTVLVLLVLCLTAVLGAFRVSSLNEAMLGNNSDYNRAWAAAEALIRDAEMDIRGRRPPYNVVQADGTLGFPCRPVPANNPASTVVETGFIGCRNQAAANTPWFPRSSQDFDDVGDITLASSAISRCSQGICVPQNLASLAHLENENAISGTNLVNLASMIPFGATYGQFTRNGLAAPGVSGNPILTANPAGAWYWVEVFRYSQAVGGAGVPQSAAAIPDPSAPFVYRITAVARGLKAGTKVVIKSVFVPYPASQNP